MTFASGVQVYEDVLYYHPCFRCNKYFQQWENFRRFYNKMLTRKMLSVILHHKDKLDEHVEDVNWKRVSSVTMLHELDKEFTM